MLHRGLLMAARRAEAEAARTEFAEGPKGEGCRILRGDELPAPLRADRVPAPAMATEPRGVIEVSFPGGATVRVSGGVDMAVLRGARAELRGR